MEWGSSGVGFFCFHALGDTKQKKSTPLDRVRRGIKLMIRLSGRGGGGVGETSISVSAPFVSLKFTFTCFLLTNIRLSVTKIKHLWVVSKAITEFPTFFTFFLIIN